MARPEAGPIGRELTRHPTPRSTPRPHNNNVASTLHAVQSKYWYYFLLHMIFLWVMGIVIKHCPVGRQIGALISCLGAIIASIVLANLLRKKFPRLAGFLFASRT